MELFEARYNSENSRLVGVSATIYRRTFYYALFPIVYLRRAGKLYFIQAQRTAINYIFPGLSQLTFFFKDQRAEMVAATKGIISNALDAFRNDYSLELTVTKASVSDYLQLGIRLKCNLT